MTTKEYKEKLFSEMMVLYGKLPSELWQKYYNQKCNEMLSFMEDKNKFANIFEKATNKEEHQHFWEILIGNTLLEEGYNPQRENKDSAPDYFFEKDGIKFHVEAKAPTAGIACDLSPKAIPMIDVESSLNANSYESGFIDGTNTMLRFTSILEDTIKQIYNSFYKSGTVTLYDKIIVAINGSEATMGIEIDKRDFRAGCLSYGKNLYCALYGLDGNEYFSYKHQKFLQNIGPIMKRNTAIANRFFCPENTTPIDGIIYSNVNMKNYFSADLPFLFFQNPNKEDISGYFPFCKKVLPPVCIEI